MAHYLVRNRCNVYYFQLKIPTHFKPKTPLFRKSLRTKEKKIALRLSKQLWLIMDTLATEYFNSIESYNRGIDLLARYKDISKLDFAEAEKIMLKLDKQEEHLLFQAIKYKSSQDTTNLQLQQLLQLIQGGIQTTPTHFT